MRIKCIFNQGRDVFLSLLKYKLQQYRCFSLPRNYQLSPKSLHNLPGRIQAAQLQDRFLKIPFYQTLGIVFYLTHLTSEFLSSLLSSFIYCSKNSIVRRFIAISLAIILSLTTAQAKCVGKFVNPITDVCWSCLFPMTIGGIPVSSTGEDTLNPKMPFCTCSMPIPPYQRVGFPVSFWEPVRLVDVTRTPFCMVNLGGVSLMNTGVQGRGAVAGNSGNSLRHSFYHVHWYIYPLIYWLELLTDFICLEKSSFDVAYMTELDPLWNDDEIAFILNPEAVLFGNPIAQAACAADCLASSVGFSKDLLFWCAGCQGSLYPFSGTASTHIGGVQASLLLTQRIIAKLHREGLLWGYMGTQGLCGKYPMPIIQKSQYKTQMVYPIPSTSTGNCQPLGRSEVLWSTGKEYPYQGEDFGYLIWRKKNCCIW